jgi:hypothetical protein
MEFETLYHDLDHGAEIIRALVRGITQTAAQNKPDPQSWSILEVICHLADEEREDFRQRIVITLHRPYEEWPPIDPQGWIVSRKYNERELTEALSDFLAERAKSLVWLKNLQNPNWDAEYTSQFGTMKAGDLLVSWVAHDNLHMRQLVELRRARIAEIAYPYDFAYAGDW